MLKASFELRWIEAQECFVLIMNGFPVAVLTAAEVVGWAHEMLNIAEPKRFIK